MKSFPAQSIFAFWQSCRDGLLSADDEPTASDPLEDGLRVGNLL